MSVWDILLALSLLLCLSILFFEWRRERAKIKSLGDEWPADPIERQEFYRALQAEGLSLQAKVALVGFPTLCWIGIKRWDVLDWLRRVEWSKIGSGAAPFVVVAVVIAVGILVIVRLRAEGRRSEDPPASRPGWEPEESARDLMSTFAYSALVIGVALSLEYSFRALELEQYKALSALVPLLTFFCVFVLASTGILDFGRVLRRGNPFYDYAENLARQNGVRVGRVVVTGKSEIGASVASLGAIRLTRGLIDHLDEPEVKAVIAHEIGHLRMGHTRVRFITITLGLLILGLVLGILRTLLDPPRGLLPSIVHSPFATLILVVIGLGAVASPRRQQQGEYEADRFAVEATNDPDLVIRALYKIYEGNVIPHEYEGLDAKESSHPSLRRRILAIMEAYPGSGSFIVPHPSGALIIEDSSTTPGTDESAAGGALAPS